MGIHLALILMFIQYGNICVSHTSTEYIAKQMNQHLMCKCNGVEVEENGNAQAQVTKK